MKVIVFAALVVAAATSIASCLKPVCDCGGPVLGLVVYSPAPITGIALSGSACDGARFRCVPADFDDTIHPDCTEIQIAPKAVGNCIVDLTAGETTTHLEHRMREYPKCCDEPGTFLGDEDGWGVTDLRDGGTGGGATRAPTEASPYGMSASSRKASLARAAARYRQPQWRSAFCAATASDASGPVASARSVARPAAGSQSVLSASMAAPR